MVDANLLNAGRQALAERRLIDAEATARQLLAADLANHDALHLMASVRWQSGAPDEALAFLQLAVDQVPGAPLYWNDLATILEKLGRLDESFEAYGRALQLAPDDAGARDGFALLVRMTGHFEEALALYDRMIERGLPVRALYLHRAVTLAKLGRLEESLPAFRESLAREGAWQSTHWEFSGPLLALKQFAEGWQSYEHRFDAPEILYMDCARFPDIPRWKGEPLAGKTILIHREQGLGDQIMFASMIPDLLRLGARVLIDAAPSLRELFRHSFPQARLVSVDPADPIQGPRPAVASGKDAPDFEAPIGSLAAVLRNDLAAFAASPYLRADKATRTRWRKRLETAGLMAPELLRVGIVWTVNPNPGYYGAAKRVLIKQMQLDQFAGLSTESPGCKTALVSLTNNPAPRADFAVSDFSQFLADFHETAGLAHWMDLVITVDTSVAHMTAAMGKETWILLPYDADWRWSTTDETSYWYANTRLFRQPAPGRWDLVMERVSKELTAKLQEQNQHEGRRNHER